VKLLAIDTTESACSAALLLDGALLERHELAPRRHGERLLPLIAELLAEAQWSLGALDAIAFGRGPGAFTGVRIATGVAQGLALGADLPLVPVSSLMALARGAYRRQGAPVEVLAALDARMGELYWAPVAVTEEQTHLLDQEQVAPPSRVRAPAGRTWVAIGSGWDAHLEGLAPRFRPQTVFHGAQIQARDLAVVGAQGWERGEAVAPEQALPRYLRNEVAQKPGGKGAL